MSADELLQLLQEDIHHTASKADKAVGRLDAQMKGGLAKAEKRLRKMALKAGVDCATIDSLSSTYIAKLEELEIMKNAAGKLSDKAGPYISRLDSLQSMLRYVEQLPGGGDLLPAELGGLQEEIDRIRSSFGFGNNYQNWLEVRMQGWQSLVGEQTNLDRYMPVALKKYAQELANTKAMLGHWKETLSKPGHLEALALKALNELPAFRLFMQQNSELAQLFGAVGASSTNGNALPISGLQSRASMETLLGDRFGNSTEAMAAIQQQLSEGLGELEQLRNEIEEASEAISELGKKLKQKQEERAQLKATPFKGRIEKSWNFQSTPGENRFPATNDFGLQIGYRFGRRGVIGMGASGRLGLGSWDKIKLTYEGYSIRGNLDWRLSSPEAKLMADIWASCTLEHTWWSNTPTASSGATAPLETQDFRVLLGLTKRIQYKNKYAKLSILFDNQAAREGVMPFVFRYSYGL